MVRNVYQYMHARTYICVCVYVCVEQSKFHLIKGYKKSNRAFQSGTVLSWSFSKLGHTLERSTRQLSMQYSFSYT